jgi:hypothetical protein
MSIIKIYQGKSKPANKKPGWQKAEAEQQAWLKSVQSITLYSSKSRIPNVKAATKKIIKDTKFVRPIQEVHSVVNFDGTCTKPVPRPDILYRDDPDMLARELKARERKFATAPAYNKGPAQYVSEDMSADIKLGLLRRR